jgi:glycerol-3-phosphate dehydrogenase
VVKVGMIVYDLLSYDKNFTWDTCKRIPWHRTVSRQAVLDSEPSVHARGLTGASIFYDCASIFPERLTLAFIKSAVARGAKASNYARVEGFLRDAGNNVTGVRVRDLLTDKTHAVSGSITVNCGGPWADIVLGLAKSQDSAGALRRSEGIHIITAKRMLSGKYVVGSMTSEGRHFFLIPWRGHTLIGTTDKPFVGTPDEYRVTKANILELIDEVNSSFGDGTLSYSDVKHTFGGLRPLVEGQTKETYTSSRRYEIYDNAKNGLNGLITVEGGKYTTSRNLAEKCLEIVMAKMGKPPEKSITTRHYLTGCEIEDLNLFLSDVQNKNNDFGKATLDYLGRNYGTEYAHILDLAREDKTLRETLNDDGEILAEAVYAVRQEMARTLSDIVLRRTGIGTLGNPGEDVLRKVAATAAKELQWNTDKIEREILDTMNILTLPR